MRYCFITAGPITVCITAVYLQVPFSLRANSLKPLPSMRPPALWLALLALGSTWAVTGGEGNERLNSNCCLLQRAAQQRRALCLTLRGAGDARGDGRLGNSPALPHSGPGEPGAAAVLPVAGARARYAEHSLTSQRGQLVGARSRAPTAATASGQVMDTASGTTSQITRSVEDKVIPNGVRTPGDRAVRFGRAAMDGKGGLHEMQNALALVRQGLLDYNGAEAILANLTGMAGEGKGELVGRRAFHCLLQAAELIAAAGDPGTQSQNSLYGGLIQ